MASNQDLLATQQPSASKHKRKGSWKRFKEWISGGPQQQQPRDQKGAPSAVFPSKEVTRATTDVDEVLQGNCYSGRHRPGPGGSRPGSKPGSFKGPSQGQARGSVDIPTIVVTSEDRSPKPPPRKSSAVLIKGSSSMSEMVPDESSVAATTSSAPASPPVGSVPTPSILETPEVMTSFSQSESRLDEARIQSEQQEDPETALKKQMAVMRIKQAIASLDDSSLLQRPNLIDRRFSDVSAIVKSRESHSRESSPMRRSQSHRGTRPLIRGGGLSPKGSVKRRKSTSGDVVSRSGSFKKPKAKPMIWEHFEAVPNSTIQGRCKTCQMTVSCKYNTGNFVRHLQLAHKDVYRGYQNKIETQWTRSMLERNLCR